jgi:hypothetical protein
MHGKQLPTSRSRTAGPRLPKRRCSASFDAQILQRRGIDQDGWIRARKGFVMGSPYCAGTVRHPAGPSCGSGCAQRCAREGRGKGAAHRASTRVQIGHGECRRHAPRPAEIAPTRSAPLPQRTVRERRCARASRSWRQPRTRRDIKACADASDVLSSGVRSCEATMRSFNPGAKFSNVAITRFVMISRWASHPPDGERGT